MTTEADRAKELAATAGENPTAVDGETVLELLQAEDDETRQYAGRAFRAGEFDESVRQRAVAPLTDALDASDPLVRNVALTGLTKIAHQEPAAVSDAAGAVRALLDDEQELVRDAALECLTVLARSHPEAVEPVVPTLLDRFEPTEMATSYDVLFCLATVARASPERFASSVEQFFEAFATAGERPGMDTTQIENPMDAERADQVAQRASERRRRYCTVAGDVVVGVAHADPESVLPILDDIAAFADNPDPQIRGVVLDVFAALADPAPDAVVAHLPSITESLTAGSSTTERAITALGALVQERPVEVTDAMEPHAADIAERLDSDDREVRSLAAGLLSYLAETSPDAVAPHAPAVRERLADPYPPTRGNAVWVLAELGEAEDLDRVATLREDDPSEEVRAAAREALAAHEEGTTGS
jgi:HEAT repeat protein